MSLKREIHIKKKIYRLILLFAILTITVVLKLEGDGTSRQGNGKSVSVTGEEYGESGESETGIIPDDSTLEIHFFDVGEADSTLVECDGCRMLIDGGNPGNSRFLYAYLEQHGIKYLDYMVCTHAHEDHVGGLAGALNYAKIGVAYAPVTEYDSRAFGSFIKYLEQQEKEITIPLAGDSFMLGHAKVTILAPIDMTLAENNTNNSSIVLRIVYGDTSFIITGDAETAEEQTILDAGYELKSTVLRAGHHGSNTSTSEDFFKAVAPDYCVISVGKDNQYGHPHEEILQRMEESNTILYRTDLNGTIDCVSDGKTVIFTTEK